MANVRIWVMRTLMILAVGVLPVAAVDCDLEDGEFEIDIDGWHDCDDDWCSGGYYYEEYYYDPWGWWY